MSREDAASARAQVLRAIVHGTEDATGSQTLVVETHEGVLRGGVEVLLPYGLASRPPAGGLAVVLAIGGDGGDLVALPAAGGTRLGNLAEGEAGLYTDEGTRVLLRAGGIVEVAAAAEVTVTVGATVLRVSPAGVQVTGNLHVVGNITATGTITP